MSIATRHLITVFLLAITVIVLFLSSNLFVHVPLVGILEAKEQTATNNAYGNTNNYLPPDQCDGVYSPLHKDRSGSVIRHILLHSFCAYHKKKTYCGACGPSNHTAVHRHLLDALGLADLMPIYDECPKEAEMTNLKYCPMVPFMNSNYAREVNEWRSNLTNTVQAHVQSIIASKNDKHLDDDNADDDKKRNECMIVVHVRRGDCDPVNVNRVNLCKSNFLPNSYFLPLIEEVQSRHPTKCRVIVYTEEAYDKIYEKDKKSGAAASLEGNKDFYDRNYTVVVGGDEATAWIDFVRADEFITSRSSFSQIPAIFARGNVYCPEKYRPDTAMPEWTMVPVNFTP